MILRPEQKSKKLQSLRHRERCKRLCLLVGGRMPKSVCVFLKNNQKRRASNR